MAAAEKPVAVAVIVANPLAIPLTVGARPAAVAPCGMKIFTGAMVTAELSALRVINTPPDGAGVASVTGNDAVWPGSNVRLDGRMIPDDTGETVTLAVAVPKLGVSAEIVAVPEAKPATGTIMLAAPAAKVTPAETEAIPGLLERSAAVSPPDGAGADRVSVRFPAEPDWIVRLRGEKELLPPATWILPFPAV